MGSWDLKFWTYEFFIRGFWRLWMGVKSSASSLSLWDQKKKKSMHYCYTKKYIIRVCNLLLLFRSDVYMYTVYIYKSQNNHLEKIKWKNGDWNDSNDYFYALSKQFEKKKKDNLFSSIDHWPSIEENKWFSMFIEYFSRSRIIASYLIDAGSYTFELKISHQIIIILL